MLPAQHVGDLHRVLRALAAADAHHAARHGEHRVERHNGVGGVGQRAVLFGAGRGVLRRREADAVVGGEVLPDVGVAVALLLHRGEALPLEQGAGPVAQGVEALVAAGEDRLALRAVKVDILLLRHQRPTSSFIQSNPRRSISPASSGPPVLTMRPSMSTWTTSGLR